MEIRGSEEGKWFVYFYGSLIVGVIIVTVFRCWRAIAVIRLSLHRREMERIDKQIALAKAKHAPVPPAVIAAPVALPAPAPQPAPVLALKAPTAEPFFALDLDEEPPCAPKA